MKNFIKSIIFILVFIFLFLNVFDVLWLDDNNISLFYKEKKNTADIVYVGSSNAYASFNSTLAFHKYGFATLFQSTDAMPFILTKYLIKEAERYQKPSLYIIDIAKVADGKEEYDYSNIRRTVDNIRFSKNKMDALKEIFKWKNVPKEEYVNFYFSHLLYHNRWKDLTVKSFEPNPELYKGYLYVDWTSQINPQEKYVWQDEERDMGKENEKILRDLIKYIKDNNLQVLFVLTPRVYSEEVNQKINFAISIIEDSGLEVMNFAKDEDLKIDPETDYYNFAHLNVYGSTKFTLYFSKYLAETYKFRNHKEDVDYKSWHEEYERFKASFKKESNKDFEEVLKEYEEDY